MRHLSTPASSTHATTLRDYLQIVRRRKLVIALCTLAVPLAALAFSLHQRPMYQGSAQVLLSSQDLGNQLTGTQDTSVYTPADRRAQTQADLARVPAVAEAAIHATHSQLTPSAFLAASSVSAGANADILTFSFTDHDPVIAARLATAYARAYVRYRLAVDTAPIENALSEVDSQIGKLPSRGSLYNNLVDKATELKTLAALKTANADVVEVATRSSQTAPKTTRNVTLGIVLGVFLGVGLAFLWEALDTRVRSAESIGYGIGLPLLARIPAPPKKLRGEDRLVMIDEPSGVHAEAFRMLRTNVEFASLGKEAQTLMVTSGTEREGKSTTIANLAVALARAGKHVVLVDLDLRRPFVERFFNLHGKPGITQVAIGAAQLDEAVVRIPVTGTEGPDIPQLGTNANGDSAARGFGALDVLPSGPIPPDPGEFVGSARLTEILESIASRCDIVLVDAPPLFHVGDGLTLSAKVDGVLVVTNLETMRRPMLAELKRQLETMPANKLGFIVTGAQSEESYGGYGYGYGYYYARPYEQAVETRA